MIRLPPAAVTILHPEGNVNFNAHLSALVELLGEQGYTISIVAPLRRFTQQSPHSLAQLTLLPPAVFRAISALTLSPVGLGPASAFCRLVFAKLQTRLVLGVDRLGVIMAALLGARRGIPHGMISYEIFFASEVGRRFKKSEIIACRDVRFALVQDQERGQCLSAENAIPADRLVFMPVAGRGTRPRPRGKLRSILGIPETKKIAVHMGSTDSWTLLNELIDSVPLWPDDWCLVVHSRYPVANAPWLASSREPCGRVFLTPGSLPTHDDLGQLLCDADVGIALYRPTFENAFTGLNLFHLGYSSGKLSAYLQHGVPVITNVRGRLAEGLLLSRVGHVVSAVGEIPSLLGQTERRDDETTQRCLSFFATELDASVKAGQFLREVARCVESP